jgi:DNA-binding MarR family transcriptional regulator
MAPTCSGRVASRGAEGSSPDVGNGEYFRFLRNGHVLSALLREILEEKLLGELSLHPLTRAQFCSLKLITLNADLRVGEVARCVGVSPSACTKNIDRLESMGLVLREPAPDDRRATVLRARGAGVALVRQYERMKADQVAPVIRSLGRAQVERLCDLLEEVCTGLLEIEAEDRGPCFRCAGYYHADCSIGRARGTCTLRGSEAAEEMVSGGPT